MKDLNKKLESENVKDLFHYIRLVVDIQLQQTEDYHYNKSVVDNARFTTIDKSIISNELKAFENFFMDLGLYIYLAPFKERLIAINPAVAFMDIKETKDLMVEIFHQYLLGFNSSQYLKQWWDLTYFNECCSIIPIEISSKLSLAQRETEESLRVLLIDTIKIALDLEKCEEEKFIRMQIISDLLSIKEDDYL